MRRAYVALGSNLGDRQGFLDGARQALAGHEAIRLLKATAVEETPPLGGCDQPAYLNQMVSLETALHPVGLLQLLRAVEDAAGRVRGERWASRTLDLDLVCFDGVLCDLSELVLPHPGLRDRIFWAREIAALEAHG